jgi:uncharacterized protein YndB with AHSA1/START domain
MSSNDNTDRIEKKILLRASRSRVWRALTNAEEFGSWFGMKVDGPFVAGATVRGTIAPTKVDAEVAKLQKEYEGLPFALMIETMDAERQFSFRWHPNAVGPAADYAAEPTTLVLFELTEAPDGVLLTVTESGFDQIPVARRAQAFASNAEGWSMQVKLIEKYLAQTS